jgi:CBS domain containing-hemolysin-like protein
VSVSDSLANAAGLALAGLGCACLAGVFASVDAAILSISPARIEELAAGERPGAARLLPIIADRARYVNLLVLLRLAFEITATALVVVIAREFFRLGPSIAVGATVMVLVSYVLIGVGPRTVGRQHAYQIAIASAIPLRIIGRLLGPLSKLLILVGNAITPGRGFREGPFASEIELRELVDLAKERGVVADEERRMIQSVFELADTTAREIMVPRPDMVWIEADKTAVQAISLAVRSGHSRVPVIGETVDDVVGVVYLKDLVEQAFMGGSEGGSKPVAQFMRPAVFVPDSKPLDKLLEDMQRNRNHMALLVDEYGGIAGLVTIEDVLEEIVGEIVDEYDENEVAPIEQLGEGEYRVSARVHLEDLGELLDVELDEEEVDTVGGLIALLLGRVPLPGATVRANGLELVAEGGPDARGRLRITTVLVRKLDADPSQVAKEAIA